MELFRKIPLHQGEIATKRWNNNKAMTPPFNSPLMRGDRGGYIPAHSNSGENCHHPPDPALQAVVVGPERKIFLPPRRGRHESFFEEKDEKSFDLQQPPK